MTLHAVKQNIIEYGKKFADIGFSLGIPLGFWCSRTIGSSGRNRVRTLPIFR